MSPITSTTSTHLFLIVVLLISWPLVFPIIVGVVLVMIYTAAVQHKMHLLSESSMQASAQRNATLVESLTGLDTVKTLGAEGQMQAIWEKTTLLASRVGVKMRFLSGSVGTMIPGGRSNSQVIPIRADSGSLPEAAASMIGRPHASFSSDVTMTQSVFW